MFCFLEGGGGFQKMNIFLGMKILWIFFGGHHKIGLYLGVISMHFRTLSLFDLNLNAGSQGCNSQIHCQNGKQGRS